MEDTAWRRTVGCQDLSNRDRELAVSISDDGRVVLSTPPGESAKLRPHQIADLKRYLDDAISEAAVRQVRRP